ncbi:hypothetical protein ACFC26_09730 [Kitasatospora purpeofusca]|uniref:hypothetical protein n=1 Tax=Kitasatospora purpeofusca TaxID=67352 RepID=UPI0035DE057D
MVATDPLWLPSISYDETELRKMDSNFVMPDGTALGSRAGIRPGDPGLAVSLSGTTVNVTSGTATLYRSTQGVYRAQLAATSPGTLSAANASFARVDLVYLRVWDTAVDSSGLRKADTVLLTGTASASPVAPTPGATEIYIPLATINVPNTGGGGTGAATVSSAVRQLTVAPGGILPVSLAADIAASGLYAGQVRFNTVSGGLEIWSGSAWKPQGIWSSFTPTWTATNINPSIGNGTLTSRWCQVGRMVTWTGLMSAGSTTNGGDGTWSMTMPVQAAASGVIAVGSCNYFDVGHQDYLGVVQVGSNATGVSFSVKTSASAASFDAVSNLLPVGTSSTSNLRWTVQYEVAS